VISYSEALQQVLKQVPSLGTEVVPLHQLWGRVLASPVKAPYDMPLFDNASVDGYGVRVSDVENASRDNPVHLRISGVLSAGCSDKLTINKGSAIKILTGAAVPAGVEAVVMQEYTQTNHKSVALLHSATLGENIRKRGEEFHQGSEILLAGIFVTPPVIGLLASLGVTEGLVYRRPKVAIVVTGNELIQPGMALETGQIYESNSHGLIAALQAAGCGELNVRHAPDERDTIREMLAQSLIEADIIITTGGVSVGEFDWVKQALAVLQVHTHFWRVAIKPGKPVYFGSWTDTATDAKKLVFGLPGNPVSVLLTFYLFVIPALRAMQGKQQPEHPVISAILGSELKKDPGRLEFVRGRYHRTAQDTLEVIPTRGQGSHMLSGLAQADCLICFEREQSQLPAGSRVQTIPLDWRCY
jgi:molybdopterin molybdotransferase